MAKRVIEVGSGIRIDSDGNITPMQPKGKHYTLKEMQEGVGGLIEFCYTRDEVYIFVVNEEGLLEQPPRFNFTATVLYLGLVDNQETRLFGDVLILPEALLER